MLSDTTKKPSQWAIVSACGFVSVCAVEREKSGIPSVRVIFERKQKLPTDCRLCCGIKRKKVKAFNTFGWYSDSKMRFSFGFSSRASI